MNSKPGANKLANVLSARMKKESEKRPPVDFGKIKADGSLVTDQFPIPIEKGEYMVLSNLSKGKISKGDRVLVVWIDNEVVVVDTVENS